MRVAVKETRSIRARKSSILTTGTMPPLLNNAIGTRRAYEELFRRGIPRRALRAELRHLLDVAPSEGMPDKTLNECSGARCERAPRREFELACEVLGRPLTRKTCEHGYSPRMEKVYLREAIRKLVPPCAA